MARQGEQFYFINLLKIVSWKFMDPKLETKYL